MDKPVRQHMQELERRIHHLATELMLNRKSQVDRNRLETELRVAQQALEHFRRALELEQDLQAR